MWNYARLPNMENADEPLGVFEDEESRAQRAAEEEARSFHCPAWLTDILPDMSLKERILGCVTCMLCGCKYSWLSLWSTMIIERMICQKKKEQN